MITRFLFSTFSLAALSTGAFAADLPARSAPPVYIPPPVHVFSWTGFYIGGNAGYAFQADRTHNLTGNDPLATAAVNTSVVAPFVRNSANGFTGGGQIGYNYEFGAGVLGDKTGGVVIGVEADAAYTDLRKGQQAIGVGGILATQTADRQGYLGTARGRVGVTFGTLLVYGTGGFAYGSVNDATRVVSTGAGGIAPGILAFAGGGSSTRTGYAAGGGIEYAIPTQSFLNVINAGSVTVKAEFLHYDLGTSSYGVVGNAAAGTAATSFTDRVRNSGNLVRAGINYKLDAFGPAPVVARY